MKRRTLGGLMGGAWLAASTRNHALADTSSSLGAGLTPLGSEQAGNADGSIPAWTGGLTTLPDGLKPNDYIPDPFASEKQIAVIDSSNLSQYANNLSEGVQALVTRYGLKINLYPTHRTHAAPQWVYDNIAANHGRATFTAQDPNGGRFGFTNAYGGVPFPVPDISNPTKAGAQIIWNHNARWLGYCFEADRQAWAVSHGNVSMAEYIAAHFKYPYYNPKNTLATYNGELEWAVTPYLGPANDVGQNLIVKYWTNPYVRPQAAWELLNGQGRVRRAPEVSFDTPTSQSNGIIGYDETYGFNGSLERYDWKYLGKQEMIIPYNNNKLYTADPRQAHLQHFFDPDLVRWEKHRCWVVEATVHPGESNVLARRRFYVDEDTWAIGYGDAWDAKNNLFKVNLLYNYCRPDLPGTVYGQNTVNNLQNGNYVSCDGFWNQTKKATLIFAEDFPNSMFDPTNMAASAQY